ncbi:tetratricopeptide repeat protein [Dapis sp. BLCC M172]|uniref:tetratricopeptide repeat protein n=1 Tax=Dapis sp. BLCC M172 TaxID=2975281 RepID=UPI003CFB3004
MESSVKKTNKVAESIERGKELRQQGLVEKAISEFESARQQAPKNLMALNQLTTLYTMQENWQEVVNCCYQIISLRPNNVGAYLRLANASAKQNNLYAAVGYFQKAIQLEPTKLKPGDYKELGDILTRLGSSEMQINQTNEAIVAYQKVVELKPDLPAPVHIKLGDAMQKQKRFVQAIASYKKALQVKPDLKEMVYIKLGQAQMEVALFDEAIGSFEKAVELKPDLASAFRNLGYAYQQKGLLDNAINNYQKAIKLNPDGRGLYILMGDVLTQQGRVPKANEYYQKAESMK